MQLHDIKAGPRKRRYKKGRGTTTAGRGTKGQGARSGSSRRRGFEGGRTSLIEQLPKVRGKRRVPHLKQVATVNVADLERVFSEGETIDPAALRNARLIRRSDRLVKVLGHGELSKKLSVLAHYYSGSAKEKIESAGGTAGVLALPERKGAKPKAERSNTAPPKASR